MHKLKVLSGQDIIKIFRNFNFEIIGQRGSHIKLRRITRDNSKQTLTVPNHRELDKKTLRAIMRQGSVYVSETELEEYFCTK